MTVGQADGGELRLLGEDGEIDWIDLPVPLAFASAMPAGRSTSCSSPSTSIPRRRAELASIAAWIDRHDEKEKDFIVLGDMNIQSCAELREVIPQGFISLNSACRGTNTKGDKPFDHVLLRPAYTTELDRQFGLEVVNLCERFPGPCGTSAYSAQFSDHNPIVFRLNPLPQDDD